MSHDADPGAHRRPNILVITVDEMQYPRFSYGPGAGMDQGIKEILGFEGDPEANPYSGFFRGFLKLRDHAVVLRNHTIAASACTPSRGVIYTGQYGSRTGLTQTDGIFKSGKDPAFPWLDPAGIPTLGDWFRAAGYSTHYFGKWHLSDPHDGSLEPWGFADWERSTPEPHGANPGNLGVYRDIGFTDSAVGFLSRKGLALGEDPGQPWLAVASLVNPHDIAGYPLPWFTGVEMPDPPLPAPQPIPHTGQLSRNPPRGTRRVELNPDGFPQENFRATPTEEENLDTKPDCHQDSALKVGLALSSRYPEQLRQRAPLPYQLSGTPREWFLANGQFYTYLHYLLDLQLRRIMDAVEENGLADDTIIVFYSDHGDYAGAHGGMIEKWHTAYAEALHVPFVVSSPRINPERGAMHYVDEMTSHADIVPTILGLAGFGVEEREALRQRITGQDTSYPLPGADLAPVIRGDAPHVTEPDGSLRQAVLFITDDCITEPLPNEVGNVDYQYFLQHVAELVEGGVNIRRGCVVQPCHVQAVRSREWLLARYWDPTGNQADQWELYAQAHDPNEEVNLVRWTENGHPVVRPEAIPQEWGLTVAQVDEALQTMLALLAETRTRMLSVDGEERALPPQRGPRRVHVGAGFVVASLLEPGAIAP